jgi:protein gp37
MTQIEWTDETWDPEDHLDAPLRWRKPRRVFVMSDLFHEDVPDRFIASVFGVMGAAQRHTFQILTKRPERMREWFRWCTNGDVPHPSIRTCTLAAAQVLRESFGPHAGPGARAEIPWPLPNVWLGVSCEDQSTANERIPILLDTPAAVRFVSAEPLIAPIYNLGLDAWWHKDYNGSRPASEIVGAVKGGIDWVICGGESGPKARPCDVEWIRSIVRQCKDAGVSCFVKQLGLHIRDHEELQGYRPRLTGKGGDPDEWPEDLRVRQWPRQETNP